MKEYYFLFALAFLWTIFATIQDVKKREVANWLNFSLIAFALAYRAFYSIATKDYNFFIFGILGFALFFVIANLIYYSKAFAGGDAKLLMGYGIILPYNSFAEIIPIALIFLFVLFFIGSIYSLIVSVFIATKNKKQFVKEFKSKVKKQKTLLVISIILIFAFAILTTKNTIFLAPALLLSIFPIYLYTKSLEKCMIKLISPDKLTEGDWILDDIKVGNKTIKKTVHGLDIKDIILLKKFNKKIQVLQGIPFVPAFLITLIIMVFAVIILELQISSLLYLIA